MDNEGFFSSECVLHGARVENRCKAVKLCSEMSTSALDERKQKPSFISQPSSVTRTELTVGRQRANNSVAQAPSKAVAKCRAAPYHTTLLLTQTLIFIPL